MHTVRVMLAVGVAVPLACTTYAVPPADTSGSVPGAASYYGTGPGDDMSQALERVFASIHRIDFAAEYRTWHFSEGAGVTEADIEAGGFEARAESSLNETLVKAGTATVVGRTGSSLTLLSVGHVVQYPRVRYQYWDDGSSRGSGSDVGVRRVASVSIRTSEHGRLLARTGPLPFRVTARDDSNDLALLRVNLPAGAEGRFPVLDLPPGNARRLSWGSFVYILGYPRGYAMVTRALVSSPDGDGRGMFITDGIWNEGMSGGLILAVRGVTGALELVGLARASAAERVVRLLADTTGIRPGSPVTRYDGPLWLEVGLRRQYGIALPVPMTVVSDFLEREGVRLRGRD